jgi:glycosyltransferase involved in cell wall biosynthesis
MKVAAEMKIAMLCYFYQDGLGFQENHLVREYVKAGHDVMVLAPLDDEVFSYYQGRRHSGNKIVETEISENLKLVRFPYRKFSNQKFDPLKGMAPYLHDFEPEIIFVHGLSFNLRDCVRYHKSKPRCRLIMDFHGDFSNSGRTWLSRNLLHKLIKRRLVRKYSKYIDQIYAITPTSQDFLVRMYGFSPNDIKLLPLGGDLVVVDAQRASGARGRVRAALGLSLTDFVVFTGGKLEPFKKTDELINAVRLLEDQDIHLVVVGSVPNHFPEYSTYLSELASSTPKVHMAGWLELDEMTAHMLAADCAVFPAGQSVVWQQAIVSGLPLIVGELPGQSVAYLNRGNIIPLKSDNLESHELARVLVELKRDPKRRAAMAKIANQVAQTELDWVKIAGTSLEGV